jgi:integrase
MPLVWGCIVDRDQAFEIVKRARAALAELGDSDASAATVRAYQRELQRLADRATDRTPIGLVKTAQETRSASTWYRRRAALVHAAKAFLSRRLAEQDALQRAMRAGDAVGGQWVDAVRSMAKWLDVLDALPTGCPIPQDQRRRRRGKRAVLGRLPDDWRELLAARMPTYRLPFLVAAVTGCRPSELARGVTVRRVASDVIEVVITGAKVRAHAGQPERTVRVGLDGALGAALAGLLPATGEVAVAVRSAAAFSTAIRDAARRQWPRMRESVTAYCLRHQVSANMKADDVLGPLDVSAALGHATDKTAAYYGHRKQARKGGPQVLSARAVRKVRPVKGVGGVPRKG